MTIKMVVFDIAGTTVYDDGSIALAFAEAMAAYGVPVPEEKINTLMGYKKTEAIRMMLEAFSNKPWDEQAVEDIHDRFQQNMVAFYAQSQDLAAMPGAEDVFAKLRKHGVTIALDTGFPRAITETIIDRLGWLENGIIDYVVSSNEVEAGRPEPYMIRKLMERAGITDPKQVVKVGDTEVDVNEGRNAGCCLSVAVTTGAFSREQLEPYKPDFIIDHLSELIPILEQHAH